MGAAPETLLDAAREAAELSAWLAGHGYPEAGRAPLPGDVSARRYERLHRPAGGSALLATYPPELRPACERFLATGALLAGAGVRVPGVHAVDCGRGWMVLEDLGPETVGEWGRGRPWGEIAPFFLAALDVLGRIAALPAAAVAPLSPPLDRALLEHELAQTWEVFLVPQGLAGGALGERLRGVLAELCARLAAEPPVPCHRDFMVRNLMPRPTGDATAPREEVAVIDHQDLRLGPPGYDLASLLNDTLFPPPAAEEELLAAVAPAPGQRLGYHRAAAQRALKAVGTYAAFARRGADRHLPLIPGTLARGLGHLARLPEGAEITGELAAAWRPVLER
jgi:aminoglycoside/choline kinase family phosphotransferase